MNIIQLYVVYIVCASNYYLSTFASLLLWSLCSIAKELGSTPQIKNTFSVFKMTYCINFTDQSNSYKIIHKTISGLPTNIKSKQNIAVAYLPCDISNDRWKLNSLYNSEINITQVSSSIASMNCKVYIIEHCVVEVQLLIQWTYLS